MPRSRLAAALLGVALVGAVPRLAAGAPPERRAALLPLEVEGTLSAEWGPKFEAAIARGLTQGGVETVPAAKVAEASGGVTRCDNAKCYQFLATSVDARFVVVSKIVVVDRNYEVALDIVDAKDGTLAASSSESCQVCGLGEVEELVTKQAAALRGKVEALSLQPAIVAITSQPPQVTVFIDGEEIGVTPLEHELRPGSHEAEARKPGFVTQKRTIDAVQGVSEKLAFDLMAASVDTPVEAIAPDKAKDWRVPTGWVALGVGIASVAAGATFLAIDERPYKSGCSGADVDASGNCRQRYNTLVHGAAMTAGGGVLVIAGAALLISARVKRGRASKNAAHRERALALLEGRF